MRATSGRWGWWAVLALLAVVAGARSGYAQGFYYKEIRKDDRIYVFNIADEADRFEKTGEMGRGLTRPGAGPNGETVVADSERALQLFFFKHNISEPVPEPPVPLQRIAWSDGKTRITTDFAYLEISNRVQVRYTQEMPDDTITLPGTGGPGDTKGSFRIRRAKFKLEGWFWIPPEVAPSPRTLPKLSYELQLNWAAVAANVGAQPANVGAFLEDANIAWDPQGKGQFRFVFGQYKVPFGRQQMTSSGNQQFVDRALVSDEYERGRDIGVVCPGCRLEQQARIPRRDVQWERPDAAEQRQRQVSIQRPADVAAERQSGAGAARVGQWRVVLRSGLRVDDGSSLCLCRELRAQRLPRDDDWHRPQVRRRWRRRHLQVQRIFRHRRVLLAGAQARDRPQVRVEWGLLSGRNDAQPSSHLGRSREVRRTRRFSRPNHNADNTELRGGLSYYYRRHTLKLQMDFGRVEVGRITNPGKAKTNELRIQSQFIF